jgi:F-type H+-transporting ATPase subunit b
MPQLVISDFAPQVVWLVITFAVLYFLLSKLVLPGIARTLGDRDAQLKQDIERAERLKSEAETALGAYQKAIAEARLKAQGEIKAAAEAMAAEASRRGSELAADIHERTKAAEAGIARAKTAALADLRGVAGEAASQLVSRLAGVAPAAAELAEAIESVGRERA